MFVVSFFVKDVSHCKSNMIYILFMFHGLCNFCQLQKVSYLNWYME